MKTAWALGLDYGYEGKTAPLALFKSKMEAEAVRDLMAASHGTGTYLVEVAYWPYVSPPPPSKPQS